MTRCCGREGKESRPDRGRGINTLVLPPQRPSNNIFAKYHILKHTQPKTTTQPKGQLETKQSNFLIMAASTPEPDNPNSIGPDCALSPTNLLNHEVSDARVENLHGFLTQSEYCDDITLAETRTLLNVYRDYKIALREWVPPPGYGPLAAMLSSSVTRLLDYFRSAFPGNERILHKAQPLYLLVGNWRRLEKRELGEDYGPDDLYLFPYTF